MGQEVDKILVSWLLFLDFFLSLNKIVIQGGAATRRDPNGEPREIEQFKARKAQLGVGGKVRSAKKYTLKFRKMRNKSRHRV